MPYKGTSSKRNMCPIGHLNEGALAGHNADMTANSIMALRNAKGITQEELAEMVKTKRDYLGKLERGDKRLNIDWIEKIAEALDVRPYQVLMTPDELEAAQSPPQPWLPREATIAAFLEAARPVLLADPVPEDGLQAVAGEFLTSMQSISIDPTREDEPVAMKMLIENIDRVAMRWSGGKGQQAKSI